MRPGSAPARPLSGNGDARARSHDNVACSAGVQVTLTAAQCSGVQFSSSRATRLAPFLQSRMIVEACPEYLPRVPTQTTPVRCGAVQ